MTNSKKLAFSLTSIPSRFESVKPILESLRAQTVKADEICLYLPRKYKRFDQQLTQAPDMPDGVTVKLVDHDYGPATKVLPAVKEYQGQDVYIFYCDDDVLYPPDHVEKLLTEARNRPDTCIAGWGTDLVELHQKHHSLSPKHELLPRCRWAKKDAAYRFKRAASLFRYKPTLARSEGFADLAEGFGGILVQPDFFPVEVFDIPDILWTVDDVWLSGHMTRKNVPIWVLPGYRQKMNLDASFETDALHKLTYKGVDRIKADLMCAEHFRETYGIWLSEKEAGAVGLNRRADQVA